MALLINGENGITVHLYEKNKINWISMTHHTQTSISGDIKTYAKRIYIWLANREIFLKDEEMDKIWLIRNLRFLCYRSLYN